MPYIVLVVVVWRGRGVGARWMESVSQRVVNAVELGGSRCLLEVQRFGKPTYAKCGEKRR